MTRSGFRIFAALLMALTVLPGALQAKAKAPPQPTTPQSFDQYPSFIELTSVSNDGTQIVVRCGYSAPDGKSVVPDPSFREISTLNSAQGGYSRLQHIDDVVIVTTTVPSGHRLLMLELAKQDGSLKAKNCQTDLDSDTIQDCTPTQNFTTIEEIDAGDRDLGQQCNALVTQGADQFNPSIASPEKTAEFKARLRQKVGILDAP